MAINTYNQKTKSTTVNPYFNFITANNEQELYDALTVEDIKFTGIEVHYIPRTDESIDSLFRESFKTSFNASYKVEVFVKGSEWESGQGNLLSKYGFQQNDAVNLIMSRTRFNQLKVPDRMRPTEGDLFFIGDDTVPQGYGSFVNRIYEITSVENEVPFWQVGKWMFYDISCRLFTFGYEKINTGNIAMDAVPDGASNDGDVIAGVNNDMLEIKQSLVNFDEHNPFDNI